MSNETAQVTFTLAANRPDVGYSIQKAADAGLTSWTNLNSSLTAGAGQTFVLSAQDPSTGGAAFYRLAVSLFNQY